MIQSFKNVAPPEFSNAIGLNGSNSYNVSKKCIHHFTAECKLTGKKPFFGQHASRNECHCCHYMLWSLCQTETASKQGTLPRVLGIKEDSNLTDLIDSLLTVGCFLTGV